MSIPSFRSFDFAREYPFRDELLATSASVSPGTQYVLLEFEKPIQCPLGSVLIGSKLDTDVHTASCRLAFQGRLLTAIDWSSPEDRAKLKVVKRKEKVGTIDRVVDDRTLIVRDMFGKDTDTSCFLGMRVHLETGEVGKIEASFGQGGKFKAYFQEGLPIAGGGQANASAAASAAPAAADGKKSKAPKLNLKGKVFLRFKKLVYATDKKAMTQD